MAFARRSLPSSPLVGAEWAHVVTAGESWATIGARVGVSPAVLASRNGRGLRPALKGGDTIVIDNRHIVPDQPPVPDGNADVNPDVNNDGLIVNVPQRLVFFFAEGRLVAYYPAAVGGSGWQTPLGDFTIVRKEEIRRGTCRSRSSRRCVAPESES